MKNRILFMISTLDGGGAERALVNLVNTIDLKNNSVDIVTLFSHGVNMQFVKPGVNIRSIFNFRIKGLKHILKLFSPKFLYKTFVRNEYDIVISYLEGECTRIISGANNNIKKITWVHTEREHDYVCAFRSYKEMISAYLTFDKIILVSNDTKLAFDKYTKSILRDREVVIKNIVDYESMFKMAEEKIADRDKSKTLQIISVGRLTKVKDMDRLVNLFTFLKTKHIKVNVSILGIGDEYENIKNHIKKINAEESIMLYGYQTNPYKYIKSADLYVCPSHKEGYSTTVLEAVVLGVPIVTTNCSGMSEILQKDKCGIIVEDNDERLFNAVLDIILDTKQYNIKKKQCLIRSKQLVSENFKNIKLNHKEIGIL